MAKNVSLLSSRTRQKRRKKIILNGVLFAAALLMFFGTAIILSRLPALQIENVEIAGARSADVPSLQSAARAGLTGAYLGIFPRSNAFLAPKSAISSTLLAAFPLLQKASVSRRGLNTLVITVEEKQPYGLWCGRTLSPQKKASAKAKEADASSTPAEVPAVLADEYSGSCYFLDASGELYAAAPAFSGSVFVRFYGELESETPVPAFFAPGQFEKITKLVNAFSAISFTAADVYLSADEDVTLVDASGTLLLATLKENPAAQASAVDTLLRSSGEKNEKKDVDSYVSIDVRFGTKIFYTEK